MLNSSFYQLYLVVHYKENLYCIILFLIASAEQEKLDQILIIREKVIDYARKWTEPILARMIPN